MLGDSRHGGGGVGETSIFPVPPVLFATSYVCAPRWLDLVSKRFCFGEILYRHKGEGADVLEGLMDFIINELLYKVGFAFLSFITGGRFKGKSSYYFYLVVMVGFLVLLIPAVLIFLGWVVWL
jgi:hypothetical protein